MVKVHKKIIANGQLKEEDVDKILSLQKTYDNGKINLENSFSGIYGETEYLKDMILKLTSDSPENLGQLEKEVDLEIKKQFGDKVKILTTKMKH